MANITGKKGKRKWIVAEPFDRKSGKKIAPAISDSDKGEHGDFCRLLRAVQTDSQTIEVLFENPIFRDRFRLIIAAYRQKPEDAEELANDVLFRISHSLPSFDPDYSRDYGNFFPWLRSVTRNSFLDTLPDDNADFSGKPVEALRVADPRIDIEAGILHNELVANLKRYITTLPAKQRLVATYYLLEGLSLRETSKRLSEAGYSSTDTLLRKWVGDTVKGALVKAHVIPTGAGKGENEFRSVVDLAIQRMPYAVAGPGLLGTGLIPFQFQPELPPRARRTLLQDLEYEFDSLLASMQTSHSKRAVQAAFEASPAQLGRAAVKQANKKR
jgi:RNA polymerase sigma factor (sigma-70 family)